MTSTIFLGFDALAKRNYEEVMSGHVGPLLASLLHRWIDDESLLSYFSFFGTDFSFIRKWTESRIRRRRSRQRKSIIQSSSARRQTITTPMYRTK